MAHPLVRHLAIIVVLKLGFLFLLWFLFFRLPDGAQETGVDIRNHIASSTEVVVSINQNEANS